MKNIIFTFIVISLLIFTSQVQATGNFFGIGSIGSVLHFAYDPYNESYIIPSATHHQLFLYDIKTKNLFPIVGKKDVPGDTTDVPGSNALLNNPSSVVLVYAKNNYLPYGYLISDTNNNCIRFVESVYPHYIKNVAGSCGSSGTNGITNGIGIEARFNNPTYMAYDYKNNRFAVSDSGNNCIRLLTLYGSDYSKPINVTTIAGICGTSGTSETSGNSLITKILNPSGLIFIPKSNTIIFAESTTFRIWRLIGISSINGGYLSVMNYIWSNTYLSGIFIIPPPNRTSIIRVYITINGGQFNNVHRTEFNYNTIENPINQTITWTQMTCFGNSADMKYTMVIPNGTMIQSYTNSSSLSMSQLTGQTDCSGPLYNRFLLVPKIYTQTQTLTKSQTTEITRSHTNIILPTETNMTRTSTTIFTIDPNTTVLPIETNMTTTETNMTTTETNMTTNETTVFPNITTVFPTEPNMTTNVTTVFPNVTTVFPTETNRTTNITTLFPTETNTTIRNTTSFSTSSTIYTTKIMTTTVAPTIIATSTTITTTTPNITTPHPTIKIHKNTTSTILNDNGLTATGVIAVNTITSFAAPSLAPNAVRFRAIEKIMSDTCKRNLEEVPSVIENPTMMYFPEDSSLKYLNGIIVGNICVIIGVIIVYTIICQIIHFIRIKINPENQKLSELKNCYAKFALEYRIFDVSMIVATTFITPVFSVGLILIGNDDKKYLGINIVLFIISLIASTGYVYVVYRYSIKKNYDIMKYDNKNTEKWSLIKKLFKEHGEWEIENEKSRNNKEINEYYTTKFIIDAYDEKHSYFALVDCCMILLLGVPDIIANYVSDEISCNAYIIALIIILGSYMLTILFLRPIQPKIVLYTTIFCVAVQLAICISKIASLGEESINSLSVVLVLSLYLPMLIPVSIIGYNILNKEPVQEIDSKNEENSTILNPPPTLHISSQEPKYERELDEML
jgi:hypothetical protein